MSGQVEIADDPEHPEGGHATVLFRGAHVDASDVTLEIETLTEGFDYRGPRRVNLPVWQSDQGVEVKIGPDIVGTLQQGLAVNIALAGTNLESDVLWPMLTPPRAAPRRRAMQAAPSRRVVDAGGSKPSAAARAAQAPESGPVYSEPPVPIPKPPAVVPHSVEPLSLFVPPLDKADEVVAKEPAPIAGSELLDPKPIEKALERTPSPSPSIEKRRSAGFVGVGVTAFAMGAGVMAIAWYVTPRPQPKPITVAERVLLPSPYALLEDLPTKAPDGSIVRGKDKASFRQKGDRAQSPRDASFWRRWAAKELLNSKTNDAAAVLSNFATDLATTGDTRSSLAAARFVWELAAVAHDCAAMDNIATALSADTSDQTTTESALWRRRADACRKESASRN